MKNSIKPFIFSLVIFFFMAFTQSSPAQEPPHPPSEKGTDTNHGPGGPSGAPIGSGMTILLVMGAAYGAFKLYQVRSRVSVIE
jgi:hypothetical protein